MAPPETLIPTNDFILLEELKAKPFHTYQGYSTIIVPPAYEHGPEDRPVMGRVLAKGKECCRATIRVGVVAMAGKWAGCRFPREGKTYILLKESDVMAVLE